MPGIVSKNYYKPEFYILQFCNDCLEDRKMGRLLRPKQKFVLQFNSCHSPNSEKDSVSFCCPTPRTVEQLASGQSRNVEPALA